MSASDFPFFFTKGLVVVCSFPFLVEGLFFVVVQSCACQSIRIDDRKLSLIRYGPKI